MLTCNKITFSNAQLCDGAPGWPAAAKLGDWGHALFLGAEPTRVTLPNWWAPHTGPRRYLRAARYLTHGSFQALQGGHAPCCGSLEALAAVMHLQRMLTLVRVCSPLPQEKVHVH